MKKIKSVCIKVTITQMLQDSSFIKIIKEVAVHESMVEIYMNTYKVKRVWINANYWHKNYCNTHDENIDSTNRMKNEFY